MAETSTPNNVVRIDRTEAPPPPAQNTPEDFDRRYKERLEQDAEVKKLRDRAARADELEREREQTLATPPPPMRSAPPPPPPRPAQGFDLNRWLNDARIDPGRAYLEMASLESQRRAQELASIQNATAETMQRALRYQTDVTSAQKFLETELPEVFDGRSALQKRAVDIYNSDPWYQSRGDGHKLAALTAAGELGIAIKSKRSSAAAADHDKTQDVDEQSAERGTRRPMRREGGEAPESPLTEREKRMAERMGLDLKKYRAAKAARKAGKDVRVD